MIICCADITSSTVSSVDVSADKCKIDFITKELNDTIDENKRLKREIEAMKEKHAEDISNLRHELAKDSKNVREW